MVVALTGGIGSGKSAAAVEFRRHGIPVHDADVAARELVAPGSEALQEITRVFGTSMLLPHGGLDRRAMRERVFASQDDRRRLEAILHPRVHAALMTAVRDCTAPYCVAMVPLLAEVYAEYRYIDRVLVVDVSSQVQLARLMHRDHVDAAAAQRVIAAQATRAQRLAIADDVIDNDGLPAVLAHAIDRLHRIYLRAAEGRG